MGFFDGILKHGMRETFYFKIFSLSVRQREAELGMKNRRYNRGNAVQSCNDPTGSLTYGLIPASFP